MQIRNLYLISILLAALFTISPDVYAANTLLGVEASNDSSDFTVTYKFLENVDEGIAKIKTQDNSIELAIENSEMATEKNLVAANGKFRDVITAKGENSSLVSKISLSENSETLITQDMVKVEAEGQNLILRVSNPTLSPKSVAVIPPEDIKNNISIKNNEANIPVLSSVKNVKAASEISNFRIIMGFMVIIVVSAGLIYFSKWFAQRDRRSKDPNRIKIVSQHFLGPRKSLAIIRVAGESLLVGITEQNITMIKALAMLDEEEIETGVSSFKNTLMDAQKKTHEDDFVAQSISEKITTKLKGMRTI